MKIARLSLLLIIILGAGLTLSRLYVPAAADPPRPNIIVIMTDDQDVDSLPVMEYLMSYPHGSWVNFENAFVSNSVCCPARATLLTGQFSRTHGVYTNNMGGKMQDTHTLPVWLRRSGYTTALVGKYLNGYPFPNRGKPKPPGWTVFNHIHIDGTADLYTTEALKFLRTAPEPYFLYLAYRAPHQPAKPLPRYKTVTPPFVPKDRLRPSFNEPDITDKPPGARRKPLSKAVIQRYEAERLASQRELMGIDDGVETIISTLEAQGQLDNTIIIFLADNGFSWGAHRHYGKHCVYDECSRVPLLIRYPALSGNRNEPRLVSNVDLASTIADFAGVTPEIMQEGRSLVPLMRVPGRPWKEAVFLERAGLGYSAIRTADWKYIVRFNGYIELYDMRADPFELNNLAGQVAYAGVQSRMAAELETLKGQHAYTVSGTVLDDRGDPLSGVVISEAGGREATTDSAGQYRFDSLQPGEYALVAERDGYRFTTVAPATLPPSATGVDFTGTLITYIIRGRVVDNDGLPMMGVTIDAGDGLTTATDADGYYTLADVPPGRYHLTATKEGYAFSTVEPVSVPPDATDIDFTGSLLTYSIHGRVVDGEGSGIDGVRVSYGGESVLTEVDGTYVISSLAPGTYALAATKEGYAFSTVEPVSIPPDATDIDFTGSLLTYSIHGRVVDGEGNAVEGVSIDHGSGPVATTGDDGYYTIPGLLPGQYSLTPALDGFTFEPTIALVSVSNSDEIQDFLAVPSS